LVAASRDETPLTVEAVTVRRRMQTLAVLPVKRFTSAKRRLDDALAGGSRRALAEAMLADVLTALRRVEALDAVLVVTADAVARRIAESDGLLTLPDLAESGQDQAVARGVIHARELGAAQVLCVAGDCPLLDPAELDALLGRPRTAPRYAVIVPDRHGTGTNALLLCPPDAIGPRFGPDSFARHRRLAEEAGIAVEVAELDSLALDVDTPEDLAELQERLAARRGGAAHTRGMLTQMLRTSGAGADR
jgi:2-phospho-L-lactate/phosphoenolpyruvate guanylyltransferase